MGSSKKRKVIDVAKMRSEGTDNAKFLQVSPRKVDVRIPGKGNSNSHGARPVHLIITMIKWTRTSRLSIVMDVAKMRSEGTDNAKFLQVSSLPRIYVHLSEYTCI